MLAPHSIVNTANIDLGNGSSSVPSTMIVRLKWVNDGTLEALSSSFSPEDEMEH